MADEHSLNLRNPEYYLNRELSLLEFNRRVLAQARDSRVPLLERLFFLSIASSNLDEFFEIRVSGLKQQVAFGSNQRGPDNLSPTEQLKRISDVAHKLVKEQYRVLNDQMLPDLAREGIHFLTSGLWNSKQSDWIKGYFNREVLPVLSPVSLDPAHPFPQVLNKSLNFIISLEGKDAFGRNSGIAIVQAPRALPRVIQLPQSVASHDYDFVYLSSIIYKHAGDLFPGMKVTRCHQFRVTRNADLTVREEEASDLMVAIEGKLTTRRFAQAVRLEVQEDCPPEMIEFLLQKFALQPTDVYQVRGPVNLHRMMTILPMIDRPDLRYPRFVPALPKRINKTEDIFEAIRKGDILLHHPFQSFDTIVDLLRQAAADPDVLVIKQTLYRTGDDSSVVDALVEAARAGKEVTVVIELRARFDEEENIEIADTLQEAGAHVSYGVVGHKTHAKMLLIVRREGRLLKRYVHLGTGNYHAGTARQYTDISLLTSDTAITDDVQKVFQQLTAMGKPGKLKKLLQAPFTLHRAMLDLINRETANAKAGKQARIVAKMNSLVEPTVIEALYRASQAGVRVDLIVRGICCLRPGIKGVSDNIHVRSIVGRFLEHSRIYYFHNGGDYQLYCSSADWMDRNFFRRIETCFPIEEKRMKKKLLKEGLMNYLWDNTQSWLLQSDGSYKQQLAGSSKARCAQQLLLEHYVG
ncbi:MAG TPA: polyphosphate kinase 1 [Pseudomonadales bacterium]